MTNLKTASLIIGTSMMELNEVNSTNTYASNLLKYANPIEGTMIFTLNQTGGQGQPGTKWESEKGKNITVSVVLYPKWLEPERQFLLSQAVALGVADFISQFAENVKIKWPNDILVDGRKIAGILIENTLNGTQIKNSVIGIGVNVNQTRFSEEVGKTAISLRTLRPDDTLDVRSLTAKLARALDARYLQLKNKSFSAIEAEYISMLYKHNEKCSFRCGTEKITGRISGVNPNGLLMIDTGKETREFSNKQIVFA